MNNQIDRDLITNKTSCYIFDIDNCLADSDHIIMSKEQAYKKELEEYEMSLTLYNKALEVYNKSKKEDNIPMPIEPVKPSVYDEKTKNQFADEYFYKHIQDAYPITGSLDVFIALALSKKVILLSARNEFCKPATIEWLKRVVIERTNEDTYRRINFQLMCKPIKYSKTDKEFKKEKITEISKQYNIQLIIEDCPEIVEEYTKLGFLVLSPNREYIRV